MSLHHLPRPWPAQRSDERRTPCAFSRSEVTAYSIGLPSSAAGRAGRWRIEEHCATNAMIWKFVALYEEFAAERGVT